MKRLIKKSGVGLNYLNNLQDNMVTVYHGTGAQNYYSIINNGLKENDVQSYQVNPIMNQNGIWVTLNRNIAKNYAIQSSQGVYKKWY